MDDEPDGMLALAIGVHNQTWPHTMDAKVWAEKFCEKFSIFTDDGVESDKEGLMIAWFANAIMAGYDTACMRINGK